MNELTAARTALEARSDRWLHVMVVVTILVAMGVVIEVWATILEVRDELRRGEEIKWHHILTFIGAILVAAFVGLECIAEYKGGDIETQLREKNSQIEQLLRQEAGDAADAASNAKASADAAGVASGKAKREADDVAKQAEQLRVDLAK